MDNLSLVLSCVGLAIGLLAFTCSCVAISFIVGLKNSTHKIEWKTWSPTGAESPSEEEEEDDEFEGMLEENPNKRRVRNEPFTPFPEPPKEEEPFFDEEDPNNTSHDF